MNLEKIFGFLKGIIIIAIVAAVGMGVLSYVGGKTKGGPAPDGPDAYIVQYDNQVVTGDTILKAIQEYRDKKVSIIVEGVDTFIWDSQLAKPGQATLISKVDPTDEKDRIRRATKIDTEPHINRETKYLCTVCIDPSSGAYTALYFQPYK